MAEQSSTLRERALTALATMIESGRIREASLNAIIAAGDGPGTLIVHTPASGGKPIDASFLTGAVQFTVSESTRPMELAR